MRKWFFLFFSVILCLGYGQYSGGAPIRFLGGDESLRTNSDSNISTVNNGSVSPISNRSIAFAWKDDSEGIGDIVLTFYSNDKYNYEYNDGDYYYSEIGTYSVSGNKLNATDPDGYAYTETFIVSNNTLILIDEFGYSKRFSKI